MPHSADVESAPRHPGLRVISLLRLSRRATMGVLLLVPLLTTGCATGPASAEERAMAVVAEFFTLLEGGDAAGVEPLLSARSDVRSGPAEFLDNEFYEAAVAHPADASVTQAIEVDPGVWTVSVDYTIGPDGTERHTYVTVSEVAEGEPRITGWVTSGLTIFQNTVPGYFEINGTARTGDFEKEQTVTALPGLYSFEYVDPDGLGTLDAEGGDTAPFEVEFPVNSKQLTASAPPTAGTLSTALSVKPVLRDGVSDEVDAALAETVLQCTSTGFVGSTCPDEVADQVRTTDGEINGATMTRADRPTAERVAPAVRWHFDAPYRVTFTRDGTAESVDIRLRGILVPAAGNGVALEFDRTPS